MDTPNEFQCRLIRQGMRRYAADLAAEAKKVRQLGFDAEGGNLDAAAETVREHILPKFGDFDSKAAGKQDPAMAPQMTIDEAIAQAEREEADNKARAVSAGPLGPGEEPAEVIADEGCLRCGSPIPEERGGDFCSDVCERLFSAEPEKTAEAEGTAVEAPSDSMQWPDGWPEGPDVQGAGALDPSGPPDEPLPPLSDEEGSTAEGARAEAHEDFLRG